MTINSFPTNSYNNIEEEMPKHYRVRMRLHYIKQMQAHTPITCPDCGKTLTVDNEEIYCETCGLVTQASTEYTAGIKYTLPHGLRLG